MKKKSIICIAVLVVLFSLLTFAFVGCKKVDITVDAANLNVYLGATDVNSPGEMYIGTKSFTGNGAQLTNTLDLSKAFGAEYTFKGLKESSGEAELNGSLLTIHGSSKGDDYFEVIMEGGKYPQWLHFHIIDGAYNVFTFEEFAYTTTQTTKSLAAPTCLFADITMKKANTVTLPDDSTLSTDGLNVINDVYGNGHVINAHDVVYADWSKKEWGSTALDLCYAKEVRLQDFKITGMVVEGEFTLNELNSYGALIGCVCGSDNHAKIVLRNIIAENSHKVVYLRNCDATLDGCVIQNASDSTLSIETHPAGGTNVTLKNCTIANSLTGGIVMWGYTNVEGTDPAKYVNLKIEGFLDIFNWKSDKETKLMPDTEAAAGLVNQMIGGELDNKKYAPYFTLLDGTRYLHLGMVVLASGKLDENRAVINDKLCVESAGQIIPNTDLAIKDFPLPSAAKSICKTCLLVGYEATGDHTITPTSKMSDNKNFYQDMYYGRK